MSEYTTENGVVVVETNSNGRTRQKETDLAERESQLRGELERAENNTELLRESLSELELSLEDVGWNRMVGFGDREFSPAGLRKIRRLARMNFLKNPLIRHAVLVQCHYVWGQGVTVSAASDEVNEVIQAFLEDPKNINTFTGHQARLNLEVDLITEGELFIGMFTNENTGRVIVRRFIADEIQQIITNPDDYQEPWFYKRVWTKRGFDTDSGITTSDTEITYHPDWRLLYNEDPEVPKPRQINGDPVLWDAPVYHVKVGGFNDQLHGCPEIYSALDWAKAVKEDLEDYATIHRAHARWAWKLTAKGGRQAIAANRQKLGTTLNAGGTGQIETNPPPVSGSVWMQAAGAGDLAPMKTAGMQPGPEEGRRLWLMISAGTGIPETILSGNADVGNLATAKTLDRPTELQMENRRQLWVDIHIDVLNFVIDMSIKALNGMLDGDEELNTYTGLVSYSLADEKDREIEIRMPSILRHDVLTLVQAIVWAGTLNGQMSAGTIPDNMLSAMLMSALGENEYDDIISAMFPNQEFTFNAGYTAPPGAENTKDRLPSQGLQNRTDKGLGDMGGSPSEDQGINFDPGAAAASEANRTRFMKSLMESSAGIRSRSGNNRSGVRVITRNSSNRKKEVAAQ